MSSTTINRGNVLSTTYIAINITPASVATVTTAAQTFNVPGLQTTDIVTVVGYNGTQTAGIIIAEADCLTAGVLTIQFGNVTGGSVTPAAGYYTIQVVRPENLPLPATAV